MIQASKVLRRRLKMLTIPNISGPVKKADYNTKMRDLKQDAECYILVTTAALNTKATEIENKK